MKFLISLGIVGAGIWWFLQSFFSSNFFIGLSTILTGAVAIWIYFNQKKENKRQIARLLVNEIRNVEREIIQLNDRQTGVELPEIKILTQNSWSKHSQLFAKDFDEDGIRLLNEFYSDAERINYLVSFGNGFELFLIQVRQRSDAIQNKIMEILSNGETDTEAFTKLQIFKQRVERPESLYHYSPQGFSAKLDIYLRNFRFVLDTPVGTKLKEIAEID